jgi:formylmethanofuran dehydrogenase subunit E
MLDKSLWKAVVDFHGHECPGLAIGFKACEAAVAELGLDASALPTIDEEIVCVTENDACGVDAIQFLLGCTYGKSNLIARLRGKMAFSFFVRDNGATRSVGADSTTSAAGDISANDTNTTRTKGLRLILSAKKDNKMSRAEFQDFLLQTPYDQLFSISEPNFALPEPARLFASHDCAICGESTAEYALRVQDGAFVCSDCYHAYQREGIL